MPTAKKLPSGSWRCQVFSHYEEVNGPDGSIKKKRIYKSFTCDITGPKGKRICEQIATEWAIEKENATSTANISIGEAINRYIEAREAVLSPRTIMDYKCTRRNYLQCIMNTKIALVSQEEIQRAINYESAKVSPKTVRNIHGLLSAVMRIYRPNFSLNTSLPAKVKPKIYVPSEEDVKALMRVVSGTEMELPILLGAFGPMRRGEICALTAGDINGNLVHVHRNMVKNSANEWIIKSPKTYAGDRVIAFPQFVVDKFPKHKCPEDRIVNLNPNMITDRFIRLLKKYQMPHFRFHDLRHYSASIQHALGVSDAYIMQRGGWSSAAALNNIYKHALNDKIPEMSNTINDHFDSMQHEMQHETEKSP